MKNGTKWIGIGLAVLCVGWTTKASALITWWAPMPSNLELPAVGENVLGTTTPDISAAKMAEIQQAVADAPPPPVGEEGTSNLVLHVWPVGAVGPTRIIYVPVSGPGPGRIAVTRTTTAEVAPVGERVVTTTRVIHHRHYYHHRAIYTNY